MKNTRIGREALKCTLPSKTLIHKVVPLRSSWLSEVIPYVSPFYLSTSSQMGARSPSPSNLHMKRICSRKRAATLSEGVMGDGEDMDYSTPVDTTHFSAAAKA